MLKICYRQYQQYSKVQTMLKNNLISLLDTTFPDANRLFTSPPRADAARSGWTLSLLFGIASAFVAGLRRPLLPNTRSGAESTATISARIRRWIFMPLLADTSVSYRKRIRQNFW